VRDTAYAVPSWAYFVAPNGNDAQAGTQAQPWRTVAKAIAVVPSGATIVLRAGMYREGNLVIKNKRLTLQPYPHEQVWFTGSQVVTGWVQDGALWRKDGWQYQFPQGGGAPKVYPGYELAASPDMVFVNGQPLRQVGSKAKVTAGTFYVDDANRKLYIGTNPSGKTVEGATLAQALQIVDAPGSVVRGLGFRHYAAHVDKENAAVWGRATRLTFEHNTFVWNAAAGLSVVAPDGVVRGNTMSYNGQLGLHGTNANRLLLEQNTLVGNNQEHFGLDWEAGGVKVTGSHDMVWRDNVSADNYGRGFWCDLSCYNTTIVRNIARNNARSGIDYELSAKALIASNVVVSNSFGGININESNTVRIINNTLVRNEFNLRVVEWKRINTDSATSSISSWNTSNVVVKNNIFSNGNGDSLRLVLVDDYSGTATPKTAAQMVPELDYNGYHRSRASTPEVLVLWSRGTAGDYNSSTIGNVRSDFNKEAHGLGLDNVGSEALFVNEAGRNYHLTATSRAVLAGAPLPTDVAAAIGVQPGVRVNLGALVWPGS